MVVPARARCLLEQQSLCKSAVCSVEKCLPSAGRQTWLPWGGLVSCAIREGSLLSFHPASSLAPRSC